MPTNTFNEAEKYLLENWQQARLVEKSLKKIRSKYTEICDRVVEVLKDEHKELDNCDNCVKSDGSLSIGREKWQSDDNYAYIAVENLALTDLSDDNEDAPFIGIWAGTPRRQAIDVNGINRLRSAAREILTNDQLAECKDDPSDCEYDLWYSLPETKKDLIKMLLEGDGQQFVDCLVAHFKVFTKFIPVLDEVFSKPGKK
jgi:hypothetical protein